MEWHEKVDTLVASIGAIYGDAMKFFSKGMESRPLADLADAMRCEIPEINGLGEYTGTLESGDERIDVNFDVVHWFDETAPTLIFHHGSADIPYKRRIEKILRGGGREWGALDAVNIIATCSPYNQSKREYLGAIRDLNQFATLLAGSAVLVEGIRKVLSRSPRVVVSGISLGGWVTNFHHAHFGTAQEYRPIFAGAALNSLFTNSSYSALTSTNALAHPEAIRACLNFEEEFCDRPNKNVYALLARYDRYIILERQSRVYRPENLSIIDKGHVTGSADNMALFQFLSASFVQG